MKRASQKGEEIVLTAEVNKKEPYKNEPVLLTIRLASTQNLSNVQVQKFEIQDTIVEKAGEPVIYEKTEGTLHVGVVEFSYLVTPLQAGDIDIPSILIQGGVVQKRNHREASFDDPFAFFQGFDRLKPFVASTEELILSVKAPVTGIHPWLPATTLTIKEVWNDEQTFEEGELFTRSFEIEAEGTHSSQLPSLEERQVEAGDFKVYSDPPKLKDEVKAGKMASTRIESYSLIPQKSGKLVLPKISFVWWNTEKNQKEEAHVPARFVEVMPKPSKPFEVPAILTEATETKAEHVSVERDLIVYMIIAGLAALLLFVVLWALQLRRRMARLLESPLEKREKLVAEVQHKPVQRQKIKRFREELDDLNPT